MKRLHSSRAPEAGRQDAKLPDARGKEPAAPAADQHPGSPSLPGVSLSPTGVVPESDVRLHSPAAAAPKPSQGQSQDGLGELPFAYGDARLVSLVRDPATLFIYWDFSQQQLEQAFSGLGKAHAVLKLFNARGTNELVRSTEVHLEARAWYVHDLPAGGELRAELWAMGEHGSRLLRAARPVRLPPSLPSDQHEAFYLRLPLDQPLPRDFASAAGRTLTYEGAAPTDWDRRAQHRHLGASELLSGSPGAKLPWSTTHLVPDLGGEEP